jgi:hypothetical protein
MSKTFDGHGEFIFTDENRVIACFNACRGFSTEELEGADLYKDLINARNEIDALTKINTKLNDYTNELGLTELITIDSLISSHRHLRSLQIKQINTRIEVQNELDNWSKKFQLLETEFIKQRETFAAMITARDNTIAKLEAELKTERGLSFQDKVAALEYQRDELLDLLTIVFDKYENGADCYESPDNREDYLGQAIRLDDKTFKRIVDILSLCTSKGESNG